MNQTPDPLDDLLRWTFAYQEGPTPDERDRARRRLDAAIRREVAANQRRGWMTAAVVAVVVASTAAIWGSLSPSPVMAAMEEVAQAIEAAPIPVTGQEYVFTDATESALGVVPRDGLGRIDYPDQPLAYLLNTRRQSWFGTDGSLQLRTTVQPPEFFRPEDEAAYYAAGLDQVDRVGEIILETFPDAERHPWPTDPAQLDTWIRNAAVTGRGLDSDIEYLEVALDIVSESPAAPDLRSGTLRLIGRLDGIEVVDQTHGTKTFRVQYRLNEVHIDHRFSINSSGYLVAERVTAVDGDQTLGLPAGATTYEMTVADLQITDSLDFP